MLERDFQAGLIREIQDRLPEAIIMKTDANYIQGFPDLLILFEDKWAALECKRGHGSSRRPNQEYYVALLDQMSFAAFIHPDNKEIVLDALQRSLEAGGSSFIS